MSRRSDFFLQPLESRQLLSSTGAAAPADDVRGSASLQINEQALDRHVDELRSALREMADRMEHLERILQHLSSTR